MVALDRLLLQREAADQRVVADHADRARHATRMLVDQLDGFRREQLRPLASGMANAASDVRRRFFARQRPQRAAQRDALFQLAQRRLVQPIGQLGLAREHEGQQFFGVGLDVCEQPNLLEELVRETLRFVDDERRDDASLTARNQLAFELLEQQRLRRGRVGSQAEAIGEKLEELAARQRRVVQVQRPRRSACLRFERGAHERRLAGAGLADEQRQPFPRRDAVLQVGQGLAVPRRQVQVPADSG